MTKIDEYIHLIRCSNYPQLRHFSSDTLEDEETCSHLLGYWSLREEFRNECRRFFTEARTLGYFTWREKCAFSFTNSSQLSPHAALLRNIFVPRPLRGQNACGDTLSQIVKIAEATGICIVAVVHPFELSASASSLESAIDAMHGGPDGNWYVSDPILQSAMNGRFRKAGFVNFDLRVAMSPHGATTIPLENQWMFVPQTVDQSFRASISGSFVNECSDE